LWHFSEIEFEIGLVLESFEEELVLWSSERDDRDELTIDTQPDMDLSLERIIVDIRRAKSQCPRRDHRQSCITILLRESLVDLISEWGIPSMEIGRSCSLSRGDDSILKLVFVLDIGGVLRCWRCESFVIHRGSISQGGIFCKS
jgi:hypothetical protein